MMQALNNAVGVSLSATVQKLGPMSDKHGELVKRVLASENGPAKAALGCYLDECREKGNYGAMDRACIDMATVQ